MKVRKSVIFNRRKWALQHEHKMQLIGDYRDLMVIEFERRKSLVSSYSLRQFARDLDLKPMHLSYVLRKERGLSREKAILVAGAIGLKGERRQMFVFQAMAKSARARFRKNLALLGIQNLNRKITELKALRS